MNVDIILWILGAELTALLVFYFSLYDPFKKLEGELIKEDKLTRIKKYFLRNALKDIKPILQIMLIAFFLLALTFILGNNPNNIFWEAIINLLILLSILLFVTLSGVLFLQYIILHRDKNAICKVSSIKQILVILKIKKIYSKKIENMIDFLWKNDGKNKELLSWFLDSLDMDEKRIKI